MAARICCSYLRIYKPASGLSDRERITLVDAIDAEPHSSAHGLLAADECAEVYHREIDGDSFFCVTRARQRWLLALLSFERATPDAVPLFFSREEIAEARRELDEIEQVSPGVRPPIVQAVWHVPPQWFVCFDDAERRIEHDGEHPTIRYSSTVAEARMRVQRALDTISGGIVHPVIVGVIYELKEWLAAFADDALIELDYASVATLFEPDDLADDHSAADVWSAISSLGAGDGAKASHYYRKVSARWSDASASYVGSVN